MEVKSATMGLDSTRPLLRVPQNGRFYGLHKLGIVAFKNSNALTGQRVFFYLRAGLRRTMGSLRVHQLGFIWGICGWMIREGELIIFRPHNHASAFL